MPRTSYFAPGVYVEEVPSAQQPIAGVGTNVVGFIGIVPSQIYVPVPNPRYDPVIARARIESDMLAERLRELAGQQGISAADIDVMTTRKERLDAQIKTSLDQQRAKLDALTDRKNQAGAAGNAAELQAREISDLKAAIDEFNSPPAAKPAKTAAADALGKDTAAKATDAPKEAGDVAGAAAAAGDGGGAGAAVAPAPAPAPAPKDGAAKQNPGDATSAADADRFDPVDPQEIAALRRPSFLRPFILQAVDIHVEVADTKFCSNFTEYTQRFGTFSAYRDKPDEPKPANPDSWVYGPLHAGHHALTHAVNGFFLNGGTKAYVARIEREDQLSAALEMFRSIDDLAIIVAPGLPRNPTTWGSLMDYAENRGDCFAILDAPEVIGKGLDFDITQLDYSNANSARVLPRVSKDAAFYLPHIQVADPAKQLQDTDPRRKVAQKYRGLTYVPPSGHLAGIYARTDTERGVHKAPANCVVRGAQEVKYYISKPMQELLNPQGVNAIRIMSGSVTVWGARTIGGDANFEWKYISVRRLFLYLKKSIEEGTQWIVFEPNDEVLWGKIRLNISAFLTNVWRSGALFGSTPEQGFYVKCDAELNPPPVRDAGQVITEIGVAIVRPAEFVIFRITQATGLGKA